MDVQSLETNESVLSRDTVVLDTRKRMGKIKGVRVDYDTRMVSHYIINSESTGSDLALPFGKGLALGDTFLTVQSREDFLATSGLEAERTIREGYVLVGAEVYAKTGDRLGTVKGFEFNAVHGTVTTIVLNEGKSYPSSSFLFFSPDFVFVDDGSPTASDLRARPQVAADESEYKASNVPVTSTETAQITEPVSVAVAVTNDPPATFDNNHERAAEATSTLPEAAAEDNETTSAEVLDQAIIDSLVGLMLEDDVVSENGLFSVKKGTKLTEEIIIEASKHDAVLLLTMNIEM